MGCVFVAAARERDEHGRAAWDRVAGLAREPTDRVRRFERGHDAFGLRKQLEAGERFFVGGGVVLGATVRREHRVLGSDAGIVEPGADRRRFEHLAFFVLQEQRAHAVHDAGDAARDGRTVMTALESEAAGFHADEASVGLDEGAERADRIRAAADTREHQIRVAPDDLDGLAARFVADDALEFAHHPRERVRSHRRAEAVVRRFDSRDPRAHGFVDRVLQGRAPRLYGNDFGTEQAHAPHVERLAFDVDRAHVHNAPEPEERGRGRGRNAVLTGTGLGDQPVFAHPLA